MKRRHREFSVFSLSFLDIISCGFGAVVMLILISKPLEITHVSASEGLAEELSGMLRLNLSIQQAQAEVDQERARRASLSQRRQGLQQELDTRLGQAERRNSQEEQLREDMQGLSDVLEMLRTAGVDAGKPQPRDEEVGGIPVDSDYVVFVIDTSGSMKQIWDRVAEEIVNVLNIHPQVKGFQILNDLGKSLISAYEGRWMEDTPARRKQLIKVFDHWSDASNSSPVEGIERALTRYARGQDRISIYVFGDDYTGSSYDPVIEKITAMNQVKGKGGKIRARIHAVGFLSADTTNRFAILMREMTRRNQGTFLALPQ